MTIAMLRLQIDQLIALILVVLLVLLREWIEFRILNDPLEQLHHDM